MNYFFFATEASADRPGVESVMCRCKIRAVEVGPRQLETPAFWLGLTNYVGML